MKTILFLFWFLPIVFITDYFYIDKYGNYDFYFQFKYIISKETLYGISVFGGFVAGSLAFEGFVFPLLLSFHDYKYKSLFNAKVKLIVTVIASRLFGQLNISAMDNDFKTNGKMEFYSWISSLPTGVILWLIYFHTTFYLLMIPMVIWLSFSFSKLMNTIAYEYRQTNSQTPIITILPPTNP